MSWKRNQYYPLSEAGDRAMLLSANLLHLYPLTRSCFETLGQSLLQKLEFGIFQEGYHITTQGDPGKDTFLLCRGKVHVVVNDQMVVEMEAPNLLGDKALVDPQSIRSATIRVAPGSICLVIKVPMHLFIRDFADASILDKEFVQEIAIFHNLFLGIQKRLFEYVHLQNNLWEHVNGTLSLLNTQTILKALDTQQDLGWPEEVWGFITKYTKKLLKYQFPVDEVPNSQSFRNGLYEFMESRFPKSSFKGNSNEYLARKHLMWKSWLTRISAAVVRVLPLEQLPFHLKDLSLFNPRNYQSQLHVLLNSTAERFFRKKSQDQKALSLPLDLFFGKGEHANEFDLKRFLDFFESTYTLKHPKRTLAQVAQRVALIAGKCENQFNQSVAQMQFFLDKTMSATALEEPNREERLESANKILQQHLDNLAKASNAYARRVEAPVQALGKVHFLKEFTPTVADILKSTGTRHLREGVENGIKQLVDIFNIRGGVLPYHFLRKHVYLCYARSGDTIPENEIITHYWISLSEGVMLYKDNQCLEEVFPGKLIGGENWKNPERHGRNQAGFSLKIPHKEDLQEKEEALFFVIPKSEVPWEHSAQLRSDLFFQQAFPVMQWCVNKHVEHINHLQEERDLCFQKWLEYEQLLRLENKLKQFEQGTEPLSYLEVRKVQVLLKTSLGMSFNAKKVLPKQLAKNLYNYIVQQTKRNHPQMPVEERSNKSYTKWKFLLSEIVQKIDSVEIDALLQEHSPRPVYDIMRNELSSVFETYVVDESAAERAIQFTAEQKAFDLSYIFHANDMLGEQRGVLFQIIKAIFETNLALLTIETHEYRERLAQLESQRASHTGGDMEGIKKEMILDTITQLWNVLVRSST